MIGVRRGCRVLGTATTRRIGLLLAVLIMGGFNDLRAARGDDPLPPARLLTEPHVPRKISQTANPLRDVDDGGEMPPSATLTPPTRGHLTDPDPAIENTKEPLVGIVVEGNKTIDADEILKKIKSRAGRPPDPKTVKDDVRALYKTRWFFQVEARIAADKAGPSLVFKVVERPILKKVSYKGNKKIKTKELSELTGLKEGGAFDVGANKESARRIESHYHEKGYIHAKVTLEKGGSPDDREVVFDVDEGPKVHVDQIKFTGNKDISGGVLRTQVKTKKRFLWLFGGKFDPTTIPEDIAALKHYYHSLGYFDVKIVPKQGVSDDQARVTLEYEIEEGQRYKVNSVEFMGNRVLSEEKLRTELKMLPGAFYTERFMAADVDKMSAQYGELGRIFAKVEPILRHHETPGIVDVVYNIDESRPFRVGRIRIHIEGDHPHTKESVVLTRLRFRPGELASREKIKKSEQALRNAQVFAGQMPGTPGPHIDVKYPEMDHKYEGQGLARGQSDEDTAAPRQTRRLIRKTGVSRGGEIESGDEPGRPTMPSEVNVGESYIFRGQNYGNFDASPSSPAFDAPAFGAEPLPSFEDQPPGYLDYDVNVSETQTGRLMFGVGVNSNAGLIGNFVLSESNFDLFRPPTSMADLTNGTAWRGGGQNFRIEATPGTQLSRYLVNWSDPYFLEQNVSLGVSGFFYYRYFPNWTEQRTGGRVTVGRQFTPTTSSSVAFRVEDVFVSNPSIPTPQPIASVLGPNLLTTVSANIVHDTRDSAFIAGKGHYLSLSYEQGYGTFVYPRVDLDARQFFTLKERPDGGNRHIVSTLGQVGWMGSEAPFFEKHFAGGFHSFRGFAFYGVTPVQLGSRVGGQFQALGTLEYMVPVTADDSIQLVAFSDMGTVQNDVSLSEFRLSVGGGVRLTIPAMGPTPIALDLGFPIMRQSFETKQIFAFYVGLQK
jgi:outer membrane protein insertion porin family